MTLLAAALLFASPVPQEQGSAQAIYKQALPSIATLAVTLTNGDTTTGTAFLAIRDGLAVTAWHVVEDAKTVTAKFADGQEFEVSGLTDKDEKRDVAIIRVKVSGRPMLSFAAKEPEVGSKAFVIGAPLGLDFSISDGLISQIRTTEGLREIQFTCPISGGNSGGPVFNGTGEVTGVVSSGYDVGQNLNFAMPIAYVRGLDSSLATVPWESVKSKRESPFHRAAPAAPAEAATAAKIFALRVQALKFRDGIVDLNRAITTLSAPNLEVPLTFSLAIEGYIRIARELRTLETADPAARRTSRAAASYYDDLAEGLESMLRAVRAAAKEGWSKDLEARVQRGASRVAAGADIWDDAEAYFQQNLTPEERAKYHPDLLTLVLHFKEQPFPAIRALQITPEYRSIPTVVVGLVIKKGPGDRGGLRPGDTIEAAGDVPISSLKQFDAILAEHKGKKLQLTVKRLKGGKKAKVTVEPK